MSVRLRWVPGVVVSVRIAIAAPLVALIWAQLCAEWCFPDVWHAAAAGVGLSPTAVSGCTSLALAFALLLPTTPLTRRDLGLTARQVAIAIAVAAGIWIALQLVQLADVALYGRVACAPIDVVGDLASASSEEVVDRLVLIGAIATALAAWPPRRAVIAAIAISTLLFTASHLPHDLALGQIAQLDRLPLLFIHGGLYALLYVSSGNLVLVAVVHFLSNEPLLWIAGPHHVTTVSAVTWLACGVVIAWYQRASSHADHT